MKATELLEQLKQETQNNIVQSQAWKHLPEEQLNARLEKNSWSILECIEHLNRYSSFYIPEITKRISKSKHLPQEVFVTGRLGNKFANSMLPKPGMKTMNTFKSKNPIGSSLNTEVINTFIQDQERVLQLLEDAKAVNISKTKTASTLPMIRFKLGDTFRFVIHHNTRHIHQAQNVLNSLNE